MKGYLAGKISFCEQKFVHYPRLFSFAILANNEIM